LSQIKRNVLGRGLSALIPQGSGSTAANEGTESVEKRGVATIAIERMQPNPDQPRSYFDPVKLEELAQSIRENGIIQPILVRKDGDNYQIIAGERRWRAAQRAGLQEVPVVVKDLTETQVLAVALIENIQRADLNAIEEALAYQKLIEEHSFTQETLAQRVGKDRTTITNSIRLLRLPERVRAYVVEGQLSMGHARALLAIDDHAALEKAARRLVETGGSVREAEKLAQDWKNGGAKAPEKKTPSAEAIALVDSLQSALATRVRLTETAGKGKLEIDFHSLDELDRIVDHMLSRRDRAS
jgi:ParB family chromosome partitioning protein